MENQIQKIREELFAAQLVIAEVLDNPHHPAMDNRHPQHDAAMEALEALEGQVSLLAVQLNAAYKKAGINY
jgi:hypothetical protein